MGSLFILYYKGKFFNKVTGSKVHGGVIGQQKVSFLQKFKTWLSDREIEETKKQRITGGGYEVDVEVVFTKTHRVVVGSVRIWVSIQI